MIHRPRRLRRTGAIRSLVRDRVDGMISNDTVPALARDLATMMRDDAGRALMAERAREVVDRFSLDASLSAWDKLLLSCSSC